MYQSMLGAVREETVILTCSTWTCPAYSGFSCAQGSLRARSSAVPAPDEDGHEQVHVERTKEKLASV